jgi:hypothetical protein
MASLSGGVGLGGIGLTSAALLLWFDMFDLAETLLFSKGALGYSGGLDVLIGTSFPKVKTFLSVLSSALLLF